MFKVAVFSDSIRSPESLVYNELNKVGNYLQHPKPAAPYKVSELFREHGYESTVFDYFSLWKQDDLLDTLEKYSEGMPLLLAFSLTLNGDKYYTDFLTQYCKTIKQRFPNAIVIVGGIRPYFDLDAIKKFADILYIGRSLNLLMDSIHHKFFDNLFGKKFEPIVVQHKDNENLMDDPVVHKFYSNDNWSSTDVAMFETSLGCKFNCTFCNYDFRAVKDPKIASIDRLVEYFNNAKEHGVTHFFAADDTVNESDDKMDILYTAIKQLDFTPKIAAYARQDVLNAKPKQVEKMSEIGLHNLFFGIESFNYDANKLIRKGAESNKILKTLKNIKDIDSNFFIHANMILGLAGDNEQSIRYHNEHILSQGLVDSVKYRALNLKDYGEEHLWQYQSDIDKNPEKYGYIVKDAKRIQKSKNESIIVWRNEWTDYNKMTELQTELAEFNDKTFGITSSIGNWSFTCLQALGAINNPKDFKKDFETNIGFKWGHVYNNNPVNNAVERYIDIKRKCDK